jgi:hypothetical protein
MRQKTHGPTCHTRWQAGSRYSVRQPRLHGELNAWATNELFAWMMIVQVVLDSAITPTHAERTRASDTNIGHRDTQRLLTVIMSSCVATGIMLATTGTAVLVDEVTACGFMPCNTVGQRAVHAVCCTVTQLGHCMEMHMQCVRGHFHTPATVSKVSVSLKRRRQMNGRRERARRGIHIASCVRKCRVHHALSAERRPRAEQNRSLDSSFSKIACRPY